MRKEDIQKALDSAKKVGDVDALWDQLSASGWSREGLMYAEVLRARERLGATLTDAEKTRIKTADAKREHGKTLPPIMGKGQKVV